VRIQLGPRRIGGWVVAVDVEPPEGVALKPIAAVRGHGPDAATIDLCRWAAWRFAGPVPFFLGTASPERAVKHLPPPGPPAVPAASVPPTPEVAGITAEALAGGVALVRIPPTGDAFPVVAAAAALGPALVVCPSHAVAAHVARRLKRAGTPVALVPEQWAEAAAGGRTVVGARSAALAPCPGLAAIVVLDAHDEAHQSEASPTWSSVVIARERARRAQVPCALVTPVPTAVLERVRRHVVPSRKAERDGWPIVEVVDRRGDDPRTGLWSARLSRALDGVGSAVLVFNRKGRARLLACAACSEMQRCERCEGAMAEGGEALQCSRCGLGRPRVCQSCGAGRLKMLRVGVSRAREELAALTGRDVAEVTGDSTDVPDGGLVIGTEAVLHRIDRADLVAFVDIDNELLAPRISAGEDALALLVRAARLVGGRTDRGRVLVQTRLPDHAALQSAVLADPSRLTSAEDDVRQALRFPPHVAMARISGAAAEAFVATLDAPAAEITGPVDGRWLVRAPDPHQLADALAKPRPAGKLRIEVDPRL
jgi:primosomal protein N' (replication factor Y)